MLVTLATRTWAAVLAAAPKGLLTRLDAMAQRRARSRAERRRRALLARQRS